MGLRSAVGLDQGFRVGQAFGVSETPSPVLADAAGKGPSEGAVRAPSLLALSIRRDVGNRAGEGVTLNNPGSLSVSVGHSEEATRYYEQALGMFVEIGAHAKADALRDGLALLDAATGMQYDSLALHEAASERDDSELPDVVPVGPSTVSTSNAQRRRRSWWPFRQRGSWFAKAVLPAGRDRRAALRCRRRGGGVTGHHALVYPPRASWTPGPPGKDEAPRIQLPARDARWANRKRMTASTALAPQRSVRVQARC